MTSPSAPLSGVRVLDFGHTVMGPSCGLILADMGAEVIKVEPAPKGDPTRDLRGFGMGYFGYLNRNKRSIAVDAKSKDGREIILRLCDSADVLIENFGPGTMDRLGLGFEALHARNPRLIYASLKGFLDGPYSQRLALDEVVQMMSGLAFMTGPTGRPLRAGTSVVDITGGLFGVIGILLALRRRDETGEGEEVRTALFETAVFLMGQHLCYAARTGVAIPPMPERVSAWAVYDVFQLRDSKQLFVGITSDNHWQRFCRAMGRPELLDDPDFQTNNQRIAARPRLMALLVEMFANLDLAAATALCESAHIPFSPIARPEDLFTDPHLAATGGLMATELPDGTRTALPRTPIQMQGMPERVLSDPPLVGEDARAVLAGIGYGAHEIDALIGAGIVRADARPPQDDGLPARSGAA